MSRHDDALFIQLGACNPSGVARSLVKAIDECHAEDMDTMKIRNDHAVRLITHQLAFLMNIRSLDHSPLEDYRTAMEECYLKAGETARNAAKNYAPAAAASSVD
jgi:hypothetical protein